ncbi:MAG: hypothetical protein K2G67_05455 [Muribaculaceae bacterium]|nr:hypothetical protein [Muribaculaceae bacterium]
MNFRVLKKIKITDTKIAVAFLAVTLLLGGACWWAWEQYITTPPYVDEEQFPVRGIDLSAHNGYVNLDAAAAEGYEFIFLKASEGATHRDDNFVLNYQKARHAGMKIGAYHFFRFDRDGIEQAQNLLRSVGRRPLELGLVIDVEEQGNPKNIPLDSIKARLALMVEYLNVGGHRVMFYSNRDGWEKYLREEYNGMPLWICSFNDENAGIDDWTFWQYNHRGKVAGIRGNVDLNAFSGSRSEWEALVAP